MFTRFLMPMLPRLTPRAHAIVALVVACACWGISFPLARALTQAQLAAVPGLSSWCVSAWLLCLRMLLAAVLVTWWCWRELGRPTRREWGQALGLGWFTAGGALLQLDGLIYTQASTSAFLTQCYAIWVPLVIAVMERRWPGWRTVAAVVVVMLGVGVLAGIDLRAFALDRGVTETLLCSLVFTGQLLWLERSRYDANRIALVVVLSFVIAATSFVPVVMVTAPSPMVLLKLYADPRSLIFLAVLAALPTAMGFLLMFRYQRAVGATAAALIYCMEPLFATAFALILPSILPAMLAIDDGGERLTTALIVGGVLILAANLVAQWPTAVEPQRDPVR